MENNFKTLVYKDAEDVEYPFGHISFLEPQIAAGTVPQMLNKNNTIEGMQKVFPETDFSVVDIVKVIIVYDKKKDSEES
jgi:hypothetical protein